MNTQLEPPKVPPLTPDRRTQLRNRVLDQAARTDQPQTRRRWVAPAVAVTAVGAVVAGSVAVAGRTDEVLPAPQVAASPSPTIDKTKIVKVAKDYLPKVDLGPVSAAEAARAADACKLPGATKIDALWSRRVAIPGTTGPKSGVVVLTKSTPGQPGGTYDLGIFTCFAGGAGAAVHDTEWKKQPSPSNPAIALSGMGQVGGSGDEKSAYASYENIFRVHPRIARIESRYVWAKGQGKWTQGVVAGGFAYTHSTALIPPGQYQPKPDGKSDLDQQYRAYDAAGKPVPINP
ncbi:hypothetical protein [Kribbella endophytica]